MKKNKILLSWSTGKDCAYALYNLLSDPNYEVAGLLTTLSENSNLVAMHGTPEALLKQQALELNLPLHTATAGKNFEIEIKRHLKSASENSISHIAFGDLFLEKIRSYREEKMKGTKIDLLFPLWQIPTHELSLKMIESGFKAVITSVDLKKLPLSFLGRNYDDAFLADLPEGIDPCGENGEFHTFVFDGPIFQRPISFALKKVFVKGNHGYVELEKAPCPQSAQAR